MPIRAEEEDKMQINTVRELFVHELRDLYNAEMQLTRALPKMAEAAYSAELRDALSEHFEETQNQVLRLERVFERLGEEPSGERCDAMLGLIAESEKVMELAGNDAVRDSAMIAAAQRVEHYEMAGYTSACAYARVLGEEESFALLQETLEEESAAEENLSWIALNGIHASIPLD